MIDLDFARHLRSQGLPMREVARRLGVHEMTLGHWLRGTRSQARRVDYDLVCRLYAEGRPISQIALDIDSAAETIREVLKSRGVDTTLDRSLAGPWPLPVGHPISWGALMECVSCL